MPRYDDPQAIHFGSKCEFFEKDGQMHGRCMIRLRDGRLVTVQTKPGEGVPIALLTHALLMDQNEGDVSGFFSDAWKGVKKSAGAIAKGKVASDLLKTSLKVAQSDLGQMALSFVPGGTTALKATQIGVRAANLIDKAVKGDRKAQDQVMRVTALAKAGSPNALAANKILKAVHAKGQLKGVYPTKAKSHVAQISKVVKPRVAKPAGIKPSAKPTVTYKPIAHAKVAPPAPSVYAPDRPIAYGGQSAYGQGLSVLRARPVSIGAEIGAGEPGYLPGSNGQPYITGSDYPPAGSASPAQPGYLPGSDVPAAPYIPGSDYPYQDPDYGSDYGDDYGADYGADYAQPAYPAQPTAARPPVRRTSRAPSRPARGRVSRPIVARSKRR